MVYQEIEGEDKQGNLIIKEYPNQIIYEIETYQVENEYIGYEEAFIDYVLVQISKIVKKIKYDGSLKEKKYAEIITQIEETFFRKIIELELSNDFDPINDNSLTIPESLSKYKSFDLNKKYRKGGRPKGTTKRTIDRYTKVFHKFTIVSKKYPGHKKSEKYELLATDTYDGKRYSSETIKNIIEEKKYLLKPTR